MEVHCAPLTWQGWVSTNIQIYRLLFWSHSSWLALPSSRGEINHSSFVNFKGNTGGGDEMKVYHGHHLWVVWLIGCCHIQWLKGKSRAHHQRILPHVNRDVLQVGHHDTRNEARLAVDNMNPPQKICTAIDNKMSCFAALADANCNNVYSNLGISQYDTTQDINISSSHMCSQST